MKRITILLIIFGIWTAFALGEAAYAAADLPSARIYKFTEKPSAPGFTIGDVAGKQVKLQDYRDKIVLLFFWTTW